MTTRLLLEGPDLEELVEQVRQEFGSRARIVRAERVRSGGFAGFFARERFEVTVDVPDEPAPPGRPRRHAVVPVASGLEDLLAAADGADGADGASGGDAARAGEEFAAVLDQVRTLVGLPVPEVAAPERAVALAVPPADQALFEALRAWRSGEAKGQHVPPYVIFHDRTLAEIAAVKPGSRAALERINGVGEGKLARYGDAVLDVVRGFEG